MYNLNVGNSYFFLRILSSLPRIKQQKLWINHILSSTIFSLMKVFCVSQETILTGNSMKIYTEFGLLDINTCTYNISAFIIFKWSVYAVVYSSATELQHQTATHDLPMWWKEGKWWNERGGRGHAVFMKHSCCWCFSSCLLVTLKHEESRLVCIPMYGTMFPCHLNINPW